MLPVLVELKLFDFGKEIHGFSLRFGLESDIGLRKKEGRNTKLIS
jgi:hypothetical protein